MEYLQSTGQQWIETNILPSLNMEFKTKVFTPSVNDDYFCSLRKTSGNDRYYLLNSNATSGYTATKSVWPGANIKPSNFTSASHIIISHIT